jgi:hypothetical protein
VPQTEQVHVIGIPRLGLVRIVCSECGPVADVEPKYAPLRMLAHYHHHEQEQEPD